MGAAQIPPDGFSVRTEEDGDALVVRASGDLDLSVAEEFEHELRRAIATDASAVFLDLGKLEFIDSTGLRALIMAAKQSSMNGDNLHILRSVSPAVERAFQVAGLTDSLPFAD
jgi:anti-anti-sigma factor